MKQFLKNKKVTIVAIVTICFFMFTGIIYFAVKSRQTAVIPKTASNIQESSKCKELMPDHNNLNEQRINLVFVGFGYSAPVQLENFAKALIDFNAQAKGLFSLEPFKSNKDKFNVWYVNEIGTSEQKDLWNLSSICRGKLGIDNHSFSPKEPLFSDRMLTIMLVNNEALHPSQFYASNNSKCTPQKESGRCGLKGLILGMPEGKQYILTSAEKDFRHDFAHAFTFYNINIEYRSAVYYEVLDEYVRFDVPYAPERDWMNIVRDHSNGFIGTYEQCNSEKNKLFGGMIGNGCGKDGVIDCCTNDENAIAQGALSCKACPQCEESERYDLEISCHEGSWFRSGNYRSTFNSIMRSYTGSQEFGKLNEKILCHQMKLLTGGVGGICNQFQPLFQ